MHKFININLRLNAFKFSELTSAHAIISVESSEDYMLINIY